jgi:acyl-CoA synthetase (AMP-forming)/AMP-acid ligase II
MGLNDFTFYDLINRNAVSFGNSAAWYEADTDQVFSYNEVKKLTDRMVGGLEKTGVRHGDRIAVLGKNSFEFFLVYCAAAALGAIVLPVNWRLSEDEVCHILNDGEPVALFADEEFETLLENIAGRLAAIKTYYNLKFEGGGSFTGFDTLLDNDGSFSAGPVSADDGFVIIHTAAVAGKPRGALLSHANLLCGNMQWIWRCSVDETDVHLSMLPLFHVAGLFMATASFHVGALNVNMSKFDAGAAVALIEEKKVSLMFDFSPILANILEQQAETGADIRSLRAVIGLDSPENIEKYQALHGGIFYCMYGQTETSCVATFGKYDDRPGSAGRIVPMAQVRLHDDQDRVVPQGAVGEIVMQGPMVFKGYWNLAEDNAATFRNGWHHTGDLARFDEDGYLFYAGRKPEKELIKPGGENVYPAEVEKIILKHPAVEKTVVFGVPDPKWKEGIKAVCVLSPGKPVTAADLIAFVGERIARYKKPQYVQFVENLPENEDGSPDRGKVKALYGGDQA